MKIEKVNDHQIRCTLTRADLADRQLKLSELAYGTDKAKDLFRDMMQQASAKFGFEAEDIPLMIEAIPLNGDCIVLIITKVEDPEELDTRFAKFAPALQDNDEFNDDMLSNLTDSADEILDLFRKVQNSALAKVSDSIAEADSADDLRRALSPKSSNTEEAPELPADITKMFSFTSLEVLNRLCIVLDSFYEGSNSLYKDTASGKFYLVTAQSGHSPEQFNRLCNILSEHGQMEHYSKAHEAYLCEHFKTLIKEQAIHSLAIMEKAAI